MQQGVKCCQSWCRALQDKCVGCLFFYILQPNCCTNCLLLLNYICKLQCWLPLILTIASLTVPYSWLRSVPAAGWLHRVPMLLWLCCLVLSSYLPNCFLCAGFIMQVSGVKTHTDTEPEHPWNGWNGDSFERMSCFNWRNPTFACNWKLFKVQLLVVKDGSMSQ